MPISMTIEQVINELVVQQSKSGIEYKNVKFMRLLWPQLDSQSKFY